MKLNKKQEWLITATLIAIILAGLGYQWVYGTNESSYKIDAQQMEISTNGACTTFDGRDGDAIVLPLHVSTDPTGKACPPVKNVTTDCTQKDCVFPHS